MTMGDDSNGRPPFKTRSSSISAPGSSSLETINQPSDTPENGTPKNRRKPATRTQSARVPGGRSQIRKKVQQTQQNLQDTKSHLHFSEPRLNEEISSHHHRRASQRRPVNNNSTSTHITSRRKSNTFLDVPSISFQNASGDEDDTITLRTFSSSNKGIINRGDSFRRRRSRSSSLIPPLSPMRMPDPVQSNGPDDSYLVSMIGTAGVGKAALLSQFKSSDCINAYDGGRESPGEQNISIVLNGIESELKFLTDDKGNKEIIDTCDAFLVIYSVVDKSSFSKAEQLLIMLQEKDLIRSRCCILVANKIDLARSRAVSTQDGKCLACTYRVKFIEVSVGINHNVDELLAGVLSQIRLKKEFSEFQGSKESSRSNHWYKNRNVVRASMKARQMITWMFGKEDSKFRNCENLNVL